MPPSTIATYYNRKQTPSGILIKDDLNKLTERLRDGSYSNQEFKGQKNIRMRPSTIFVKGKITVMSLDN